MTDTERGPRTASAVRGWQMLRALQEHLDDEDFTDRFERHTRCAVCGVRKPTPLPGPPNPPGIWTCLAHRDRSEPIRAAIQHGDRAAFVKAMELGLSR